MDNLLNQYGHWATGIYLVLGAVAAWEALTPRRPPVPTSRWLHNGVLFAVLLVCGRLALPAGLIGVAVLAGERGWGMLAGAPLWLHLLVALLGLDLLRYGLHRLMHRVPALWRVHRTHHSDSEVDFTTALRFHPLELVVELAVKSAAIVALGLAPLAVAIHELVAFTLNAFSHGNVRIHPLLERWLRRVLVTPDMHRVHHSVERREHDSNYAAAFSIWDRLFGTYLAEPTRGHDHMQLGVTGFTAPRHLQAHWMLLNPLLRSDHAPAARPDPLASGQHDGT